MKKVNDENIDELFRVGLNPENEAFASMESDWTKLEQRLNQRGKRKKLIFWLRPLSGIAALILLFFTIWMLWPSRQDQLNQQIVVQEENKKPDEDQNQAKAPAKHQEINIRPESKSTALLNGKTSSEKVLVEAKEQNGLNKKVQVPVDSVGTMKRDDGESPTNQIQTIDINETKETLAEQSGKTKENEIKETSTNQLSLPVDEKSNLQSEPEKPKEKSISPDEEPLFTETEIANLPKITEPKSRSLALSFLVSSDYNGVNTLRNGKMGNDIGLLITYGLSKRWSFSTGGIYAKKLYEADYYSYKPQKDIWSGYYPKSVDADCRVLDIPLNINYTFLNRKRTTLSVGTGISSYIMLSEYYKFTYKRPTTTEPQDYKLVNENQHWFSVFNVQANYERKLTPRLSLSFQPYLKIPLSEIGFANIKLESLGLAISASWNFNL
ncbi:MAG: hypothetical protein WC384_07755 [Prolixibacteraceae bacterium]|jgi:hypothetical protein